MPAARARPRIAVTGLGAVSAFGWDVASLEDGLLRGQTAIGPFDRFDHARDRTHVAAQVPRPAGSIPAEWQRLALADRYAIAAASEAWLGRRLGEAGPRAPTWTEPAERRALERTGVFFASSSAGMREGERYFEELCAEGRGPVVSGSRPPVRLLASQLLGAPGEAVARALGAGGPVQTISTACASGALAIEAAALALEDGEVDIAVTGGADALCRVVYSGFNALRAVDPEPCRPFRKERAGMSLGEGAAVLVLERMDDVVGSDRRPVAELLAAASTCDASHMTAPHPEGLGAADAIRRALELAGLDASAIGHVNAHGTGTSHNDAAEREALRAVLGDRAVPVSATKALVGHLLGCAGSLEAVATILCLRNGTAHACPAGGTVEDGVDLVVGSGRPLPRGIVALSLSLGFGGSNGALLLSVPGESAA